MFTKEKLTQIYESFNRLNVMIIGDVMVDSYIWGKVERISPEAPVPIVAVNKRSSLLGGAANVALNIKSLGAVPVLCSVIGNDDHGNEFMNLLKAENIGTDGICQSTKRITTTKFRIIGNNAQMLRVDEEMTSDLDHQDYSCLLNTIQKLLDKNNIAAIIFQDYNKGVITPELISEVVAKARQKNIPVSVDPKKKNFEAYHDVTLFKPNLKELKEGLKLEFDSTNRESLEAATLILHQRQNIKMVMATLSEAGVFISINDNTNQPETHLIPAHRRSITDVSGAGDTVISVATLCLALNMAPGDMAALSNLAGGLVCEFVGVAPVNKKRLFEEAALLLL